MKIKNILIVFALLCPSVLMADDINLGNDDDALLNHIKRTDYVFTTALGQCESEQTIRDGNNFVYTGFCKAKAAKESDCPGYKVTAKGTVDTESWATVRDIKLELKCNG